MTWWRRLLGLPEPKDVYNLLDQVIFRIDKRHYTELVDGGWLGAEQLSFDVTPDRIIITRRPMSRRLRRGAEGAQPQDDT